MAEPPISTTIHAPDDLLALRFSGERPVYITVHFHPDRLLVCVADSGQGFDPGRRRRKTLPGMHQPSGRGLYLMEQLMDDVTVSVPPLGCLVRMGKRLQLEPAGD